MTFRETVLSNGIPARIARISFSGELAYEVNVTGWHGLAAWKAVFAAGAEFDITPYGTEPGASIVDVSANRTTIEVRSRELLEHGCTLDLHPRAFHAGHCAQTMIARTQVALWQTSDEPVYRLLVRPSFATYLADWLSDAG
jgi:sarcosine oxidase subunit gamma